MDSRFSLSRRRLLVVAAGTATATFAPTSLSDAFARSTDAMKVNSNGVRLRSGPGLGYRVLASLSTGVIVRHTEPAGVADGYRWTKCMVESSGTWGYVATTFLSPLEDPGGSDRPVVKVSAGPLRVRSQPGLSGSVIASMPAGSRGVVTTEMPQEADGYVWVNVQFDAGPRGWVAKSFLTWV